MKNHFVRYLAGILFIVIGIYDWMQFRYLPETLLYVLLGAAFILMGFIAHHPEHPQKKVLNTISWVLIIGAALSFMYVLTIPGGKNLQ